MKVLHFFKTYYPDTFGGIEQVIFQICEGAHSYGVESSVLTVTDGKPGVRSVAGHNVVALKKNFELLSTPFSLSAISKLSQLSREVDVVHYHYPWPFMDVAHLLGGVKAKSVVTYHSDVVKQKFAMRLYAPLMNQFLSCVDSIVATSPNYLRSSPVLKRFAGKTEIIPIGLDVNTYPVVKESILSSWKAKFPGPFFLFVGVLRYYKGLDTLLEACLQVPYPVLIVGDGPEGDRLRQLAMRKKLQNVHFLGARPDHDKVALLHLCHALVFPSHLRSEAFGISLLEAAMYGKPMISCEIGTGTTYINRHDETGLAISPGSPVELATAMHQLMKNPIESERMGERARERYQALFTADEMVKKYVALYGRLMG